MFFVAVDDSAVTVIVLRARSWPGVDRSGRGFNPRPAQGNPRPVECNPRPVQVQSPTGANGFPPARRRL